MSKGNRQVTMSGQTKAALPSLPWNRQISTKTNKKQVSLKFLRKRLLESSTTSQDLESIRFAQLPTTSRSTEAPLSYWPCLYYEDFDACIAAVTGYHQHTLDGIASKERQEELEKCHSLFKYQLTLEFMQVAVGMQIHGACPMWLALGRKPGDKKPLAYFNVTSEMTIREIEWSTMWHTLSVRSQNDTQLSLALEEVGERLKMGISSQGETTGPKNSQDKQTAPAPTTTNQPTTALVPNDEASTNGQGHQPQGTGNQQPAGIIGTRKDSGNQKRKVAEANLEDKLNTPPVSNGRKRSRLSSPLQVYQETGAELSVPKWTETQPLLEQLGHVFCDNRYCRPLGNPQSNPNAQEGVDYFTSKQGYRNYLCAHGVEVHGVPSWRGRNDNVEFPNVEPKDWPAEERNIHSWVRHGILSVDSDEESIPELQLSETVAWALLQKLGLHGGSEILDRAMLSRLSKTGLSSDLDFSRIGAKNTLALEQLLARLDASDNFFIPLESSPASPDANMTDGHTTSSPPRLAKATSATDGQAEESLFTPASSNQRSPEQFNSVAWGATNRAPCSEKQSPVSQFQLRGDSPLLERLPKQKADVNMDNSRIEDTDESPQEQSDTTKSDEISDENQQDTDSRIAAAAAMDIQIDGEMDTTDETKGDVASAVNAAEVGGHDEENPVNQTASLQSRTGDEEANGVKDSAQGQRGGSSDADLPEGESGPVKGSSVAGDETSTEQPIPAESKKDENDAGSEKTEGAPAENKGQEVDGGYERFTDTHIVDADVGGNTVREKLQSCLELLTPRNDTGDAGDSLVVSGRLKSSLNEIETFLRTVVESKGLKGPRGTAPVLHVCGAPGSGKSKGVASICDKILRWTETNSDEWEKKPTFSIINCSHLQSHSCKEALKTTLDIMKQSEKRLKRSSTGHKSKKAAAILILDEIDLLVRNGVGGGTEEYLHTVLGWANNEKYVVAVVGISNSVENSKTGRLKSLGMGNNKVVFNTYDKGDLVRIVESRIGNSVVDRKVLEFLASKVAATSGDARKFIGLVSNTIQACRERSLRAQLDSPLDKPVVKLPHAMAVIRQTNLKYKDLINDLPLYEKNTLCVGVQLARALGSKPLTLGALKNVSMEAFGFDPTMESSISLEEFKGIIERLQDAGVLKLANCDKRTFSTQGLSSLMVYPVRFDMQLEDVESALEDTLLQDRFYQRLVERVKGIDVASI